MGSKQRRRAYTCPQHCLSGTPPPPLPPPPPCSMRLSCTVPKQYRAAAEAVPPAVLGLVGRCRQHGGVLWKGLFLAQVLLVAALTLQLSTILYGGGADYKEYHNEYCLQNDAADEGIKLDSTVNAPCAYDYNFKKVAAFNTCNACTDLYSPFVDCRFCTSGVMESVSTQQALYSQTFHLITIFSSTSYDVYLYAIVFTVNTTPTRKHSSWWFHSVG